jgi:hypothetical protein
MKTGVKLGHKGVGRGVGRGGKRRPGGRGQRARGRCSRDEDVPRRIENEGETDVSLGADVGFGEDLCRFLVRLQDADAVFLIEQEIQIAGDVALNWPLPAEARSPAKARCCVLFCARAGTCKASRMLKRGAMGRMDRRDGFMVMWLRVHRWLQPALNIHGYMQLELKPA